MKLFVDRIENNIAVCVDEFEKIVKISCEKFNEKVKEGCVVFKQNDKYIIDWKATELKREENFELQSQVFKKKF